MISLTKERVQLNKITTNNTITVMIASRMKQLYSQALTRYSQNTRFWDEYLKFLQQFKFLSDISKTFEQMLQVCSLRRLLIQVRSNIQVFFFQSFIVVSITVTKKTFGFVPFYGNLMKISTMKLLRGF